ncbi:phage tail protein [Pseudomonas nitroreducens]|uniref:phage tail protein n=1 Tax=Pseudomonas nitroreducens TaxID=46680 RepID=UPI00351D3181
MAVTYYALLTTIGAGKLANAAALGTTLKITQLAVGDGGGNVPTPDASRTALVNEVRRAPLNQLSIDPANSAQIIAEQVIPENVGGWWIREMGLYDDAGALIAYANCAPSYKPQLAEGSGRTQTVRIVLIVSNAASVELKIDPSVVLATREYVDNSIVTALNRLDYKQSVRAATTASITLSGLQTVDGVALAAGDRVLVKNQGNAADNGLYVVAAGTWKRATDADDNSEVTPGLTVTVESGTAQADSVWQLVTDGAIVLGTTALAFQNITNGLARLASPAFTGNPTAPTAAQFNNDTSVATTAFVQNALGNHSGFYEFNNSTVLASLHAGAVVQFVLSGPASVTLPKDIPKGAAIRVVNATSSRGTLSVIVPGGVGSVNGSGGQTKLDMNSGTEMEFVCYVPDVGAYQTFGGSGGCSLTTSGYQKMPTGLIFQWGAVVAPAVAAPIVFPIPFPNAVLHVEGSKDTSGDVRRVSCSNKTKTGFTLYGWASTGTANIDNATWFAVGF